MNYKIVTNQAKKKSWQILVDQINFFGIWISAASK